MEELIKNIQLYWPTILQYGLMFLAYFLVFFFRGKVNGTSSDLKAVFKENIAQVVSEKTAMQNEFTSHKNNYDEAVKKIQSLEKQLFTLQKAVHELTDYDIEEVNFDA